MAHPIRYRNGKLERVLNLFVKKEKRTKLEEKNRKFQIDENKMKKELEFSNNDRRRVCTRFTSSLPTANSKNEL